MKIRVEELSRRVILRSGKSSGVCLLRYGANTLSLPKIGGLSVVYTLNTYTQRV